MTFLPYNNNLKPFAKKLRTNSTDPECMLWKYIRKKQILNVQFYRQKVIGDYIVDFFAPAVKLVIEIDGAQHYENDGVEKDLSRDAYLNELGLKVLRFDNNQVKGSLNSVLDAIYHYVEVNLR
ncbi:MAG: endonuclease domain-containing protein [Gammaproteobacteria bacterium]|nr:endonuclease domain-containing protein [Gammaproteobacteria bacterium]